MCVVNQPTTFTHSTSFGQVLVCYVPSAVAEQLNSVWNVGYLENVMKVFKSAFLPCLIVS